jgi:hypothetical protein
MKISTPMVLAPLAILLTSCATTSPPQTLHNAHNDAVAIDNTNVKTNLVRQPATTVQDDNDMVAANVVNLSKRQTATTTPENNDQPQSGLEYHIHGTPWFIGLRGLRNEHVVFLQGKGASNPEGLITLTQYF